MRSARLEEIRADFNEGWKDRVSKREMRTALKEQRSSWPEDNTKAETARVKMLTMHEEGATRETKTITGGHPEISGTDSRGGTSFFWKR